MFPPRKDPYQSLIEQFIQNNQQLPAQNEQRFVRQREERLVEEERAHQEEVRQQQYARQDAQFDQERQNALTDQSRQLRAQRANSIAASLPYLTPGSEDYRQASAAIDALRRPSSLTGEEAFNQALYGLIELPEWGEVNTQVLDSRLQGVRSQIESDQALMDTAKSTIFNWLANDEIPREDRVNFYNKAIAGTDFFTDDMRMSIFPILSQMEDTEAIRAAALAGDQIEATIAGQVAQTALTWANVDATRLGMKQDRRMFEIDYNTAVHDYEQLDDAEAYSQHEAFLAMGLVPSDDADAERMARERGYGSVDELRQAGQEIFSRRQEQDKLQHDIEQRSYELLGVQVDSEKVALQSRRLQYKRDEVYGDIMARANLAEIAAAAATNGDVNMIAMLQSLRDTGMDGGALDGMKLDTLATRAQNIADHQGSQREHQEAMWEQDTASRELQYETDLNTFVTTIGATRFTQSDFEVREDGSRGVEEDVDRYLEGFGPRFFSRIGVDRETMRERLLYEATTAEQVAQRDSAGQMLTLLEQSVPHAEPKYDEDGLPVESGPTDEEAPLTSEQQAWKGTFLSNAEQAEIDPDVAEQVANGLLAGSNMDYWAAMLENELSLAEIRERRAATRLSNMKMDAAEQEGPFEITEAESEEARQNLNQIANINLGLTNTAWCTVAAPQGSGEISLRNEDECIVYRDNIEQAAVYMSALPAAYAEAKAGNPESWLNLMAAIDEFAASATPARLGGGDISLGSDGGAASVQVAPPTPEMQAAEEEILGLENVVPSDWEMFKQADPGTASAVMRGYAEGRITADQVMPFVLEALSDVGAIEGADEEAPSPIPMGEDAREDAEAAGANFDLADGRLREIGNTREWHSLVQRVANGETLTRDQRVSAAREFGFRKPSGVGIPGFGLSGSLLLEDDLQTFEWALNRSVQQEQATRRRRSREPAEEPEPDPGRMPNGPTREAATTAAAPEQEAPGAVPKPLVFIDAGHGVPNSRGIIDPGAYNRAEDIRESNLNLTAAERLNEGLQGSATTLMARTGESGSSLDERVQVANESGAQVYVSIHHNSVDAEKPGVFHNDTEEGIALAEAIAAQLGPDAWVLPHTDYEAGSLYISRFNGPGVLVEMGPTRRVSDEEMDARVARVRDAIATWASGPQAAALDPRSGPPQPPVAGRP